MSRLFQECFNEVFFLQFVEQNIEEEILHGDDLEYLDKESYVQILMKRGMVNHDGVEE